MVVEKGKHAERNKQYFVPIISQKIFMHKRLVLFGGMPE